MPPQPDPDSSDEGVPPLTDNDSKIENILNGDEEDDDDEDSKDEPLWNSGMLKCKSLFDSEEFESAEDCLEYCQKVHNFNIKVLKKRHSMDCFSYIRLINFIRSTGPSAKEVMSFPASVWADGCFMKPTLADDPMLMVDIDEDIEGEEEVTNLSTTATLSQGGQVAAMASSEDIQNMKSILESLRKQLEVKNEQLEAAVADMEKMKRVTQTLVEGGGASNLDSETIVERSVSGCRSESEDSGYAGSYAHFGIHHEMLSDKVRTETYRDSVAKNVEAIKGKKVLDLGCGTGILSMFCARHGQAEQVVGVDMSSIAHQAMDIVMENKLADTITIVKGRLEDTDLKARVGFDKFDVLISEWMGYFLLFEGMLDSVMKARDTYLTSKKALILPNRCTMHLVGVCDEERYSQTAGYFKDVYGFKMSCLREPLIKEASVEIVPKNKVITSPAQIHHLDMNQCTLADTEFEAEFELTVAQNPEETSSNREITAIAGYFDTFFDDPVLKNPVMFSTGPDSKPTHWKQTVFYLHKPLPVLSGQTVQGKISVIRPTQDIRALRVKLSIGCYGEQLFLVE